MKIIKSDFGSTQAGEAVSLFSLQNDNNVVVDIMNYGGIITSILAPDKNGKFEDVVLGFDNLDDYLKGHPYFGAICGRYANRIAKGKFTLDGKEYTFVQNNDGNHLHGGTVGFDKVVWDAQMKESGDSVSLILSYVSADMEEGYPGKLLSTVVYTLNNNNEIIIDYKAVTDKKTHINLTNHSYFNLNACAKNIYDHKFQINADTVTEVDATSIPLGNLMEVEGTPYDFRKMKVLKDQITKMEDGFDHNFVLKTDNNKDLIKAAEVIDPESGRKMEVLTTEPGVQFYTANYLDGTLTGKNNIVYKKQYAFCLETQHFPDSPNNSTFPSTVLNPGDEYIQKTIYKFSVLH